MSLVIPVTITPFSPIASAPVNTNFQAIASFANACLNNATYAAGAPSTLVAEDAVYFNTSTTPYTMYVQHAGAWHATGQAVSNSLISTNNLSDVASASASLAHLGGAPLASPTFSGTPTAPTPSTGDSSTKIATTAYVKANLPAAAVGLLGLASPDGTTITAASGVLTATGALPTISNDALLANISGASAQPSGTTLTALLDAIFGTTQGSVLYRGATAWALLPPASSANQLLQSGGPGANPAWFPQVTFGSGAPSTLIGETAQYYNTAATPYVHYVQHSGAWVKADG